MDYEKKYNNALIAVKKLQEANPNDEGIQNWIDDSFPELKEPEDEKVRKALIRFHKSTIDVDGIKGEDIIAWLEKQGERKSAWSEEDKEMIDKVIDYMMPMPIFFESTNGKTGKEYTKEFVKNATKWLKSLKQRMGGKS